MSTFIEISNIKQLREQTGLSIAECKKALEEANNDLNKALKILQKKSQLLADKKSELETKEGIVHAYIHSNGKIGVLIELLCQTDFVARNQEFKTFANDLAMQIAALDPVDVKTLLSQEYIKDPSKTVEEVLKEQIAKLGENIKIGRFARYQI